MCAERILVIDDDQQMLEMTAIMLEDEGYQVVTCFDPRDIEDTLLDDIALVITDWRMSFKTGFEVAGEVRAKNSGIKIIVYSANQKDDPDLFHSWEREGYINGSLAKPFDFADLSKTVRAVLDRKFQ